MDSTLKLTINDSALTNEINIDVGKINVVGGVNGSGKTTVAKVLYCFLKVLSDKKNDYLHKEFVKEVNNFNKIMNYNRMMYFNQNFENTDSYKDVLNEFKRAKKLFFDNNLDKTHFYPDRSYDEGYEIIFGKIESLIDMIEGKSKTSYFEILDFLMSDEDVFILKDSGCILKADSFNFISNNQKESFFDENSLVSDVFYMDTLSILDLKGDNILFKEHIRHLKDSLNEEPEWWKDLGTKLPMSTVNMLIEHPEVLEQGGFEIPKKVKDLIKDGPKDLPDENKEILSKIENIVKGQYRDYDVDFGFKKQSSNEVSYTNTTPSGIKQIGVIQILLSKGKLKKGSFLIIDEPEVNLHPKWQFKFAEILVLLAKELDISLYLNSHSPMFIEAIDAFCEFYDLEEEVNFYLTEESEVEGKYDFTKIRSNELFKLYNNLGDGYKLINKLRIRKRLSK